MHEALAHAQPQSIAHVREVLAEEAHGFVVGAEGCFYFVDYGGDDDGAGGFLGLDGEEDGLVAIFLGDGVGGEGEGLDEAG